MAENIKTIISAQDKGASRIFSSLGSKAIALNQGLELLHKAFTALSAPVNAVIDEGRKFGAQMSAIEAVTKGTADQMALLSEEARRLGESTVFTAIEAGQAMEELGRAGQTTSQIIETTGQALNLAAANAVDLADSAKLLAIQMNVFKDEALSAQQAADLINQTINSSPQNFEDFNYAMQYAGQTASSFNRSFAETTQIIGALAETGVRGSMAGTALSMAFARLAKPVPQAQKALEKYGISLQDINPETHQFADIIDVLNKHAVTNSDLFTILGQRTAPKFFKIIQQGGDAIRNFAEKQAQANTALESANVRLNNLEGDVTLYNSAVSGLKLNIFDSLDAMLRSIVQNSTEMVIAFSAFIKANKGTFTQVVNNIGSALDYVGEVVEVIINTFGTFLKTIGTFIVNSEILQEVVDNIANIFSLVIDVIKLLSPLFKPLIKLIGTELKAAWDLAITVILNFVKIVQKLMITALKSLKSILEANPEVIESFKQSILDTIEAVVEFKNYILELVDSFYQLINKGLDKVLKPLEKFAKYVGLSNEVSEQFDETLTGNTLSVSLQEVGEKLIETGTDLENWRRKAKEADKAAKNFDDSLKKVASQSLSILGGGSASGFGSAILQALTDGADVIKTKLDETFSEFKLEDVFSFIGSAFQQLASSVWALFTSNEKFNEALNKVFATIGEVAAPIIEAFIPVLEALNNSIKDLAPLFQDIVKDLGPLIQTLISFLTQTTKALGPIIRDVIKRIVPFFQKVFAKLGPSLVKLTESVGPVLNEILDIILPILEELLPIIEDIIDLISELNPLIVAVLQLIKVFLPIIKAVIRIVSTVVHVIVAILKPIIQILINIIKTITSVIEGVFKLIENIVRPLFDALINILKLLVDSIKSLISSPFGGGGGSSGGGLFGGLPGLGGGGGLFGFQQGTDALTKGQLLRLPGMEANSGLIKAHVGESVGRNGQQPLQLVFNISTIDPKASVNEIRKLIEELRIQGKL